MKKNLKEKWLKAFNLTLKELESESDTKSDDEWTRFMTKVFSKTGEKINCYVQSRFTEDVKNAGEFLNMDAMYFSNEDIKDWRSDFAPIALPPIVIEHENQYLIQKIEYCLWKILCIRAQLRILICYQDNIRDIYALKKKLEKMIERLKISNNEDVLIIIGDEKNENSSWPEYFNCYEWKGSRLEVIDLL